MEEKEERTLTWYGARENYLYQTEYGLYYDSFMLLQKARDTFLITVDNYRMVNVIIRERETENQ